MVMFSAQFNAVAVTAVQDLFSMVAPATTGICCVHRCLITQSSDFGDANEEAPIILIKRGATTVGSGGSSVTAADLGQTAATFGGTVRANDTTVATAGTITTLHAETWNIRGPFDYVPTPENRIWLGAGIRLVFGLATAPADSITVSGTLIFESL